MAAMAWVQKGLAGVGEPDVAAHGLDQRQAKGIFELADLHGHRWLGHKQPLGRLGHRALARHFQEGLDLFEGVGSHGGLQIHQISLMKFSINVIGVYEFAAIKVNPPSLIYTAHALLT